MRRAFPLSLALVLLLPLGCKKSDPEADGRKVTAESTYDATDPIVHEGFRFRLESPGPGWKLMRKEDIRHMVPNAAAGAAHPDGVWGAVIVERLPGVGLEEAETLVGAHLPQAVVESTEATAFGGHPARRTVFTAVVEGVQFRYMRVLLIREGFLYQLLSWGPSATTPATALEPFSAAISLTDGEIRGEANDHPPVEHADGVTWQIRDGRFASVISGLRTSPPSGWRYLVGQELTQANAEAELVLANDALSTYVAVISERYEGGDPSGLVSIIRGSLAQNLGPATDLGRRPLAGQPVPFMRHHTATALEFQVGVLTGDGAVTQILAWYPQALAQTAAPAVDEALGAFTLASASEREALREQLLAREGVLWRVTASSVFLGDTFRDFAHRVAWVQPRGLFAVQLGDEAKANGAHMVLTVRAPLPSVHANLEVVEGDGARVGVYHENVASTLEDRRDEPVAIGSATGQRSRGHKRIEGVDFELGVVSAEHQGHTVIMTAWGPAASPAVGATIDEVLGGLDLPAVLPDTTIDGDRFVDHHYGVSMAEPRGGWQRSDQTPTGLPVGRATRWHEGTSEVVLISSSAPGQAIDEAWMASFAEQTLRDLLAMRVPLGEPRASKDTLGGRASRRLVYDAAQLEIVVRDAVLYMLLMSNVSDTEAERLRRSVQWH